jgi:hypothetical protein
VTTVIAVIGWIFEFPTGETGYCASHTFDILIGSFDTPETTTSENRRISLYAAR